MGRGRGKGKKQNSNDDPASGEEEKIPTSKRRGRPQKTVKNDTDLENEEAEKIAGNGKHANGSLSNEDGKDQADRENTKKRKRSAQVKKDVDSVKEENGIGTKSSTDDSKKSVGFRQNGNRRKNKPRRAAEAIVECQ